MWLTRLEVGSRDKQFPAFAFRIAWPIHDTTSLALLFKLSKPSLSFIILDASRYKSQIALRTLARAYKFSLSLVSQVPAQTNDF